MSNDITRTIDDCHGDYQTLLTGLPDDVRDGLDEYYDRQAQISQAELDALEMQHAERECEIAALSTAARIAVGNVAAVDAVTALFPVNQAI